MHETRYAEAKGSGIRTIRDAMAQANLTPPTFESDREKDCFVVTFLFHHFLNEDDVRWLGQFAEMELSEDEQKALVFVKETGAINNAAYRDINRVETLVASSCLRRLRDLGLLEQKGKSVRTYYVPTVRMMEIGAGTPALTSLAQGLTPARREKTQELDELPSAIAENIVRLGKRATPPKIRAAICDLCAWKPLKAEQIARYLGRKQINVTRTYLAPMVRDGKLEYTFPDNPAHPQQAYRTRPKGKKCSGPASCG